jgi:hypothetical protein
MSKRPQPQSKPNTAWVPTSGAQGKLTTRRGDQLPVRVFEGGEGVLTLVPLVNPGSSELRVATDQLKQAGVEPVVLEYVSPRGLARFRGEAVLVERDVVRFTVTDEPEIVQRRQFVRVDAAQPVEIMTGDNGDKPLRSHAIDVSGGGMLVSELSGLKEGDRVRFRLELEPGKPPLVGWARAVRVSETGRCGFAFEDLTGEERQRLIHFVFDRQRAARAKTRDLGNVG